MTKINHKPSPDFICIGQQKAATNWLYEQLVSHREFSLPPVKEFHFFDRGFNFKRAFPKFYRALSAIEKGELPDFYKINFFRNALLSKNARTQYHTHLAYVNKQKNYKSNNKFIEINNSPDVFKWYGKLFALSPSDRITGDITPGYSTFGEDVIAKIHQEFPKAYIVIGLRRPVERFWSQVCQAFRHKSLSKADVLNVNFIEKLLQENQNFIKRSFPIRIFEKWEKIFGSGAMIYYLFENVVQDPEFVRSKIVRDLGAKSWGRDAFQVDATADSKASNRRIPIPNNVRVFLESYFRDEIEHAKDRFPEARKFWA